MAGRGKKTKKRVGWRSSSDFHRLAINAGDEKVVGITNLLSFAECLFMLLALCPIPQQTVTVREKESKDEDESEKLQ
jgi:non-ribosomal peptide synthetase component E (peptide arylation enzyme)